jgi:hypothetical protein
MFVSCPSFNGSGSQLSAFELIVRQKLCELVAATEDKDAAELVGLARDLLLFKS